jgi:hypothetical protein
MVLQGLNFGIMQNNVDGLLRNIDIVAGDTKGGVVIEAAEGIETVLY